MAVVKMLLAKDGVDPDYKDEYRRTPLAWAAWNGRVAVVELLLAKDDVDPDSKDDQGRTPLLLTVCGALPWDSEGDSSCGEYESRVGQV